MAAQRTVELAFSTWNIFELENVKWWADDSLRGALFFKHSVNEHCILGPGATRSGQRHGPCLPALWTVSRNLRAPAAPAPRSRLGRFRVPSGSLRVLRAAWALTLHFLLTQRQGLCSGDSQTESSKGAPPAAPPALFLRDPGERPAEPSRGICNTRRTRPVPTAAHSVTASPARAPNSCLQIQPFACTPDPAGDRGARPEPGQVTPHPPPP